MYVSVSGNSASSTWKGFTLILPAISVGNVGQLACDLLIHTLKMTKTGFFYDQSLQPLCGNDAFISAGIAPGELATSAEVYESQEKRVVVVQQRAGLVEGRAAEFRRKLIDWIKETSFSQVVLLTSCFAYEKTDVHILRSSVRYLATPSLESRKDAFVSALVKGQRLEKKPVEEGLELPQQQEDIPEAARDIYLPGGGIAKTLFVDCCREDVALAVLLLFCSEGDNTPDAMTMASYLNSLLPLIPEPDAKAAVSACRAMWRIPASWTMLYGRPADPSIY